ncbi:MAG: glycosyltransferase family 2 protein [Anaerolineales bacterium]|nr:glycosyltransferase family 2 protein [Anaerolineales bacterium]
MARFGINPARGKTSAYQPASITVALLTYIPHLDGYFRNRFEILQLTLASLVANTSLPYDLFIFDNGSISQVVDYLEALQEQGTIRYLFLSSENIGKIGAFELLFNSAPGEYVAYSDDDIYFYPGWLEAHLDVLETFPNVGMVSGAPVRDASDRASRTLKELIAKDEPSIKVSFGKRIPDEWESDWALSVGRDPEEHLQKTRNHQDIILECGGVEAFGSASHFQFLSPKKMIVNALPEIWSGQLMGEMNELDQAIDQLGYLRLSTVGRYTRHLGNAISPDLVDEAQQLGVNQSGNARRTGKQKHWLLAIPGSGRLLRRTYNSLFNILHNID